MGGRSNGYGTVVAVKLQTTVLLVVSIHVPVTLILHYVNIVT